jgi:hypothetical protein
MKKVYKKPLMEEVPLKACGTIMFMSFDPGEMRRRDPIP